MDRQLDLERRRLDLEVDLLPEVVLEFAVFVVHVLELQHLALAVGQAAVAAVETAQVVDRHARLVPLQGDT